LTDNDRILPTEAAYSLGPNGRRAYVPKLCSHDRVNTPFDLPLAAKSWKLANLERLAQTNPKKLKDQARALEKALGKRSR